MSPLLAFWSGGVVAIVAHLWIEYERGALPEVAYVASWRFGLALLGLVLCWPAGFVLVVQYVRRQRREREAEQAEWERIEATRRPLVYCPATRGECERPCVGAVCLLFDEQLREVAQWWICPNCNRKQPVPAASSPLVSRVHWFCEECLQPLSAPARCVDPDD